MIHVRSGSPRVDPPPPAGWRVIGQAVLIGIASAVAVTAVPELGWLGVMARIAPSGLSVIGPWLLVGLSIALAVVATWQTFRLRSADRRAAQVGFAIGAVVVLLFVIGDPVPVWRDARAYFDNSLPDVYDLPYQRGGIAYPPPFAQAILPLVALGWPAFAAVWFGSTLVLIGRLLGPAAITILLIPLVALDVANGNVNLVIAAALVYGFRWPEVLAVPILAKVTPVVSLVWFLARGEWHQFARAVAATSVITLASIVIAPDLWAEWIDTIQASSIPPGAIEVGPLLPRLVMASVLVGWAARTDRAWVVPVAVVISLPVVWPATFSILIACAPLRRRPSLQGPRRRAVDWALRPGPGR